MYNECYWDAETIMEAHEAEEEARQRRLSREEYEWELADQYQDER